MGTRRTLLLLVTLAAACSTHSAIDLATPTTPTQTPTVTHTATPTPGLVGSWNFDEGSGVTTADGSGFANDGALAGGAAWGSGRHGGGILLNGIDSSVDVPPSASLAATTALTIAFWINPQDVPGVDERLVDKLFAWDVKFNGTGLYGQLSSTVGYSAMQPSCVLGTWQHLAFTFHLGDVHEFRNGVEVGVQGTTFSPGAVLGTGDAFVIGSAEGGEYAKGAIDEVRYYRRALSPAEIAALAAD